MQAMPASPARAAAFDILLRVERESSYASDLLHSKTYQTLSTPDHALATELVMGVLRWRSKLDDEIAQASSLPLKKLDLEILTALRLALYQFRHLDRIPSRAALHESVELVKRARKRSAGPFVNAVLRKLSTTLPARPSVACAVDLDRIDSPQALAAKMAHPQWLVERWSRGYGLDAAQKICRHDQSTPTTTIRLRTPEAETEARKKGISLAPGAFLVSARRVQSGDITKGEAFRRGNVAIQDEASQLVAALVGKGRRVLDCCAAPGGKTAAMATRMPEAEIVATELHPHRATLLRRLVPQQNVEVMTADALALPYGADFDRVLADVPCSGTGTLARNPEIKWKLKPEDLLDLQTRQVAILKAAMRHVAPGGRLVYSTCSLEPEENEQVIAACIPNSDFKIVPIQTELQHLQESGELVWKNIDQLISGDFLRTIPGVHPCDGFFAAVLEKN